MKVGDTVKSKTTGYLYKVVEHKKDRDGYICESIESNERFYFFDEEVEVVSENAEKSVEKRELPNLPKTSEVANALITIQNDLFCSESVLDLGKKYVSYQDILKQLFLKALEKVCE